MWIRRKHKVRFRKAEFRESNKELDHPGCGWYHVYPFVLQTPTELSLEETAICISDISKKEQLVLVRIDIGAFRSCEIPQEALDDVFRIFDLFRACRKQMIVRFTYDSEGKGMEREPQNIFLVKKHMEQLGGMIRRFASDILVLQGIFVGSWGEMHHSKFLTVPDMSELICSLYHAVGDSCYLAVRTPGQWRDIIDTVGNEHALKEQMGLFNDGMFGSPTDLGTYKEGTRQEELEWQERFITKVPNGGEALAGETPMGYFRAAKEMQKMHLSYLNSSYQPEQLEYWKKECVRQPGCWNGLSGYEYIGRHLGSRFMVSDARVKGKQLEVIIENRGFSGFHEEAECFLELEGENGSAYCKYIDTNVSEWGNEKRIVLQISLSEEEMEAEERKVYFQMKRKRDGRPVRFANQDAGDRVLLGSFNLTQRASRNTGSLPGAGGLRPSKYR